MLDMWTDVFACPGKRTTGTDAQDFVLCLDAHAGDLPAGATRIVAPTPHVWIIGRTLTNGPDDYGAVNTFQRGWSITPTAPREHVVDTTLDTTTEPLRLLNAMSAIEFFTYAAECLKVNKPHTTDFSVLARIADIGLVPGEDFDAGRFDTQQIEALDAGLADARREIAAHASQAGIKANGWTTNVDTMGVYGNAYLQRSMVALVGLGANPADDAIYPLLLVDADGEPLVGATDYVIHFEPDALPPTHAFWSVTMYDDEGFQTANELDRFAIGDRDSLRYNDDGSLDLYLQHINPGPDRESNWLPAPTGPLGVTMRLYAPRPSALDGRWSPPQVRKN